MGRSVSYATGAEWVMYCDPKLNDNETCWDCEGAKEVGGEECETCNGEGDVEPDYDTTSMRWDDFIGALRHEMKTGFPSLHECDHWLGNEDHSILENGHAYIGVSEYCGLVSVWCVPKENEYGGDSPLASRWASSIERKASKALDRVARRYVKLASMSNGEGVYQRAC